MVVGHFRYTNISLSATYPPVQAVLTTFPLFCLAKGKGRVVDFFQQAGKERMEFSVQF
jgi:hypothetical protein